MNQTLESIADLIDEKRFDDASVKLNTITDAPDEIRVEKLFLEGRLLSRQGNWQAAADKYREVLAIDAEHADALFSLGYICDLQGDDDEAIACYEQCIQEPPTHVHALLNLAVLYEDHGRFQEALDLVEAVLDEHPVHPRAKSFQLDLMSSLTMYYDEEREATRQKHDAILDTPISEFELSVRSRNCLKQMDINSIGDLLRITEAKLLAYKNFGETSLNEIKTLLTSRGLRLGQALEETRPAARPSAAIGPSSGDPNLLNRSVAELELSVRSRKCLQRLNINTLAELTSRSEGELLAIKNFGQTSLNEIKRRLGELGMKLREQT